MNTRKNEIPRAAMTSVPEEIVRDILSKLHVKPLLRFKCLSKSWYALISSPDFIKLHFQSNNQRKFVVENLIKNEYTIYDEPYLNDLIFGESTSITPSSKHTYSFLRERKIMCSCDGLLVVRTRRTAGSINVVTLWNPSTRETRILPPYREYFTPHCGCYYALGYDSSIDDYKLVELGFTDRGLALQVLSLRSNYWRNVKDFKSDMRMRDSCYINLNEALHWLIPDEIRKIVCFNLAKETLIEMEFPEDIFTSSNVHLCVLQGCLCLSETIFDNPIGEFGVLRKKYKDVSLNVWLMKEYGVKASWTKFITIPHLPINGPFIAKSQPTPFCFMNKAVFNIHQGYMNSVLVVYDLEENNFGVVELVSGQKMFCLKAELTFVESLLSPNCKLG